MSGEESEPTVHEVTLPLCSLCLSGAGGICHVPGCALCRNTAPDIPLDNDIIGPIRPLSHEPRPLVITLCGSTRFPDAFALANMHLSLQGHIVIGLGMFGHADQPEGARFLTSDGDESTPEKQGLDVLHFRKIDLSDGIYVVNVGGYVGSSTLREIAYAREHGKSVEFMFDDAIPEELRVPFIAYREGSTRAAA